MSDKLALSDLWTTARKSGSVICAHWADWPENSNPGVGFSRLNGGVGESEFVGLDGSRGEIEHNFGIPIHNLWDKRIRNLWDSSIICGTAPHPASG
jgi:hypothetical protein